MCKRGIRWQQMWSCYWRAAGRGCCERTVTSTSATATRRRGSSTQRRRLAATDWLRSTPPTLLATDHHHQHHYRHQRHNHHHQSQLDFIMPIVTHVDDSRVSSAIIRLCDWRGGRMSGHRDWFCPHDKTKTAKTKIVKLGAEIVHHDTSPTNEYWVKTQKVKGQSHRVKKCKKVATRQRWGAVSAMWRSSSMQDLTKTYTWTVK